MSAKRYPTIIIGAGVAGLRVARNVPDALVIEAAPSIGGRVRTVEREPGDVDYEAGPWRVHDSHVRMRRLISRLGLTLTQTTSSRPDATHDVHTSRGRCRGLDLHGGVLSKHDERLLASGVAQAVHTDLESGYEGFDAAAADTTVYGIDQRHPSGAYYVCSEGFGEVIRRLASGARVKTNWRVTDVTFNDGTYTVVVRERVEGSRFETHVCTTSRLVIAVPPRATMNWTICRQWLRAQVHSVRTLPLHHIYGRLWDNQTRNYVVLAPTHLKEKSSRLSQVVSGDHDPTSFQVSYSGGRRARFWNRLKLEHGLEKLTEQLRQDLLELLEPKFATNLELHDVRSHHFEHAVHYWVPAYGFRTTEEHVRRCITPHVALPELYWCGEAFSSHQGWMEGALETAEMVCEAMRKDSTGTTFPTTRGQLLMSIEGRLLDVSSWAQIHPGSRAAIEKYAWTPERPVDATEIFEHIRHPEYSWAIVFSLQSGWSKNGR